MSFVTNDTTIQQLSFTDSFHFLTKREQRMLEKSWAKYFADEIFPKIDEKPYAVLYSPKDSRLNTPVNVQIGALIRPHEILFGGKTGGQEPERKNKFSKESINKTGKNQVSQYRHESAYAARNKSKNFFDKSHTSPWGAAGNGLRIWDSMIS